MGEIEVTKIERVKRIFILKKEKYYTSTRSDCSLNLIDQIYQSFRNIFL